MAVPYETIKDEAERVCSFVIADLDCLITRESGGNYVAAALIMCACDAIAHLKYGQPHRGDLFFAELLPELWKPVAKMLYSAIRSGLVHVYETKTVVVGSTHLNIVISWKDRPHLHLSASGADLYVNVAQLSEDLKAKVAQFLDDLKVDGALRETFYKAMRRERQFDPPPSEQQTWKDVLSRAPKAVH